MASARDRFSGAEASILSALIGAESRALSKQDPTERDPKQRDKKSVQGARISLIMPSSPHGHAAQRPGSHPADSGRPHDPGLSYRAQTADGLGYGRDAGCLSFAPSSAP